MTATPIAWESLPATEVYPGITRQTVSGAHSTIVRYTYAPGSSFPMHSHPEEQMTVVHSGQIVFIVDGEEIELRAGQLAIVPGEVPHGAYVAGDEVVVTDNYIPSGRRSPLQVEQP